MQKWEYWSCWVFVDPKTKNWCSDLPNGQRVAHSDFLHKMGEDGWEIVGAVNADAANRLAANLYDIAHWLYFKRPKQ